MKGASYRVVAWLLAVAAIVMRALPERLVGAEAGPQEAIQAPDPDYREPASIRVAVVERAVTEARPVAVLSNALMCDPPVNRRRWQQSDILGSPTALMAAAR
jgi:hypothetical protein